MRAVPRRRRTWEAERRLVDDIAADTRTKENPVMRLEHHIRPRILSSGTAARCVAEDRPHSAAAAAAAASWSIFFEAPSCSAPLKKVGRACGLLVNETSSAGLLAYFSPHAFPVLYVTTPTKYDTTDYILRALES